MRGEGGIFDPMTLINEIKECIDVDLKIDQVENDGQVKVEGEGAESSENIFKQEESTGDKNKEEEEKKQGTE